MRTRVYRAAACTSTPGVVAVCTLANASTTCVGSRRVPQTSVFFSGIVTELDGDTANVVFGQHGSQWVWVKDAAEPGVEVMHYLGFRATLQVRAALCGW